MRIGHGFDVHKFTDGSYIYIGGVKIPHTKGILAHSDGDLLLHAITDALLGAAALGDIGRHFPDTDDKFRDISSRKLLVYAYELVCKKKYFVINLDCTIVAQAPKMQPYIDQMRKNISKDLAIDIDNVNVKATTTENLGYTGRKEGISAHAVVLLDTAK